MIQPRVPTRLPGLLLALLVGCASSSQDPRPQPDAGFIIVDGGDAGPIVVVPDSGPSPSPDAGSPGGEDAAVPTGPRLYDGPELRTTLSLNGAWSIQPQGGATRMINVPGAWDMQGVNTSHATYTKTFAAPSEWQGRRVLVDFQAVNYDTHVSLNGTELGAHTGVLKPFTVEVTSAVSTGDNTLTVDVTSHDTLGARPEYPVGFLMGGQYRGIVWDVNVRAVPAVYIDDAFVQPSVRNHALAVTYTIVNTTSEVVVGKLQALADDGSVTDLGTLDVSLEPGSNEVSLAAPWASPRYWSPEDPHLYHLETQLWQGATVIDVQRQRFGFRELWAEGDQLRLNGVRYNLRGESSHRHNQWVNGDGLVNGEERYFGKTAIRAVVQRWKELGFNAVRFHQAPPAPHVWDACDELGILGLNESTMYSYDTVPNGSATYSQHALEFIPSWIKASRNHPSLVINVVENEMWLWGRRFNVATLTSWGDLVKQYDPTRLTMFEGGWDLRPSHADYRGAPGMADIFSYHYAQGGGVSPSNIRMDWPANDDYYAYALTLKQNATPNKPVSHGEFLWGDMGRSIPAAHRMMAMATRAQRYAELADIRPYQMSHLWVDPAHIQGNINGYETDAAIRELEINSFAAIAAFDIAYDRLGYAPATPRLTPGSMASRTIVVYNDELTDDAVRFSWEVRVGGNQVAGNDVDLQIPLGGKVEVPLTFTVPQSGGALELVLRTSKRGTERFREVKSFTIQ